MATIQLGNTKVANKLMSYAEKRAEEREGINCPAEYARAQFKATRELWGKNDGIQAHHVIQSFKPGEVTPEQANEIGRDLAKDIAKGHECVVYTHTDRNHVHNHIVINSVNYEDGSKYHAHGDKYRDFVREKSDELCKERDLSIVTEKTAQERYTLAEKALVEKGQYSWKDEIREKVDQEKQASKSYEEFKQNMFENHGIEVRERGKNVTYYNHENDKRVRGNKLGNAYEKETIKHEFEKRNERAIERSQERRTGDLSGRSEGGNSPSASPKGNAGTERSHVELHSGSHGQIDSREDDLRQRNREDQGYKPTGDRTDEFDITKARETIDSERRQIARGFSKWNEPNDEKQQRDPSTASTPSQSDSEDPARQLRRHQAEHQDRDREHEQERSRQLKRPEREDFEHDIER